ncbi:MAG: hypothetical protein ACI89J_002465 [Hyphomicrobiaceae bacterium]
MTHNQRTSDSTRSAILSYVSQSELRGAHNFAATAQPIVALDLATTPTPWSQDQHTIGDHHTADRNSSDQLSHRPPLCVNQTGSRGAVPDTIAETDFLLETRLSETDPPFHPPASWHKAATEEQNDAFFSLSRSWNWSERSTAAFLGFAAGILIVVPVVLFLSATSDRQPMPARTASVERFVAQPDPQPVAFASANVSAGTWFDSRAKRPTATTRDQPTEAIEVVSQAHRAITEGRIDQARTILRAAASPDTPRLWFMLAETYDPLVSAQTPRKIASSRKLEAADTNFARFYYQQALTHGISEARARLDGLTKQ